jgi:hypothetical protein
MNSKSQTRRVHDDPGPPYVADGVVAPLSGPSYGAYSEARRKWRKPLPAIIADALANNRAIIARFKLGVFPPSGGACPHHQEVFDQLCRSTDAQIAALEAFAAIKWRGY